MGRALRLAGDLQCEAVLYQDYGRPGRKHTRTSDYKVAYVPRTRKTPWKRAFIQLKVRH